MDRTLDNATYMQTTSLKGSNAPSKVAKVLNEAYENKAIAMYENSDTLHYKLPMSKLYAEVFRKISAGMFF